ncbi:MAG: efflux RND transporter permease subunit [Prevotella sp.]|nr:efflux RND transporter permease subunit [Prevotella sp.]
MPYHYAPKGENVDYVDSVYLAMSEYPIEQRENVFKGLLKAKDLLNGRPEIDIRTLKADYLIKVINEACDLWHEVAWSKEYNTSLFFDYVLPYRLLDEPQSDWRKTIRQVFPLLHQNKILSTRGWRLEAETLMLNNCSASDKAGASHDKYVLLDRKGAIVSFDVCAASDCCKNLTFRYSATKRNACLDVMCETMKQNNCVVDLTIETPGHENQEDEFYMRYDKERMALYGFDLNSTHQALKEILSGYDIEKYKDKNMSADMYLKSSAKDKFDLWHLQNAYLKVNGTDTKISDFMQIERREAKNCIPKKNQEYVLRVAFNVLGSYTYTSKYIEKITKEFNAKMPVGYRCLNTSYGWYEDDGTQYWLILLIVIIIYFICAILFESLRLPLVIISLIPVSFIGTFLTYYFSGVEFGTGGFASLVLLSGLTVNGGIYIINEYKNTYMRLGAKKRSDLIRLYVRAYNHKIIAVMLTILSTVLGLIPFFIDGDEETFWFSFAVGSAGGLLFSVIAIVFIMPIFMKYGSTNKKQKDKKRQLQQILKTKSQ